jgi:hypothetical protein
VARSSAFSRLPYTIPTKFPAPCPCLQGLLGLDDAVSPGYEQIRIDMRVKADCSDEDLDDLLAYAQQHSPVCNTVCRPVPVLIQRLTS